MYTETNIKILLLIILFSAGVYLFKKTNVSQNDSIVEGFETEELLDKIHLLKKDAHNLKKKLNIGEKREYYEDYLKYLDTYIGGLILSLMVDHNFSSGKDLSLVMKSANTLSEFQKTINTTLHEWLDNQVDGMAEYGAEASSLLNNINTKNKNVKGGEKNAKANMPSNMSSNMPSLDESKKAVTEKTEEVTEKAKGMFSFF